MRLLRPEEEQQLQQHPSLPSLPLPLRRLGMFLPGVVFLSSAADMVT